MFDYSATSAGVKRADAYGPKKMLCCMRKHLFTGQEWFLRVGFSVREKRKQRGFVIRICRFHVTLKKPGHFYLLV